MKYLLLLITFCLTVVAEQPSNYAMRFEQFSDTCPIKQACSKINGNSKLDDSCAILSNFLYCFNHPEVTNRPEACKAFCSYYESEESFVRFIKTLETLQVELHLDPKDIVSFMRNLQTQQISMGKNIQARPILDEERYC